MKILVSDKTTVIIPNNVTMYTVSKNTIRVFTDEDKVITIVPEEEHQKIFVDNVVISAPLEEKNIHTNYIITRIKLKNYVFRTTVQEVLLRNSKNIVTPQIVLRTLINRYLATTYKDDLAVLEPIFNHGYFYFNGSLIGVVEGEGKGNIIFEDKVYTLIT